MWKTLGHFFASIAQKVLAVADKAEASKPLVEGVTAAIPVYGPLALPIENAAYAVLGEVIATLNAGGAAAEAGLANAGLDTNVIATAKAVGASAVNLAQIAKALPSEVVTATKGLGAAIAAVPAAPPAA